MKNLLFFLLCLPLISFGQQTINASIMHDNIQRDYIMYIPASYSPANETPLVFCFHGYTSNASTISWYSNFNGIADTAGFIAVYPQGTLDGTGTTHWNVGGWTIGSTVDDIGFTDALLDTIMSEYNIDDNRVYSTGMSNGGYMSFQLACQLSDRIAAIASITGSMTPETYNACDPDRPVPVLQMHGTMDATVPYNGNAWSKSIDEAIQYWVSFNNCNPIPTTTSLPNTNTGDGSTVEQIVYDGGDENTVVEHFKVTGGDHDWPGAWGNMDIDASKEVWKFFYRHRIPEQAMDSAFCDSLVIDCCSFGTAPTLSFDLTNNSSYNFSYPGFVLFDTNGDTVAVDDGSNVFTIMPGQQTRYLDAVASIPLPFTGYLNLYDDYFAGPNPALLCSFQVSIQDTAVTSINPDPEMNSHVTLESVHDILGRLVHPPLPANTVLFFRYSNGKAVKRMLLKSTH